MNFVWGAILIVFTLIVCWLGQVISTLWPTVAAQWGLTDVESEVDTAVYADARGEAVWDVIVLWTLPVAGILLILNNTVWPYFGLVGGGMYLYFAGRGISARLAMRRRGIRIGKPESVRVAYVFLTLWGLIAIVTIVMSVIALS